MKAIKTPNLNKWGRIHKQWEQAEAFIAWLHGQGLEITRDGLTINDNPRAMLSRYFKLDLVKLDDERRALLDSYRQPVSVAQ